MHWTTAVGNARRDGVASVLVTVASVRGHAPRAAGAKMLVTASGLAGTVGGGNVEAMAIESARAALRDGLPTSPWTLSSELNPHVTGTHGQQCCGGEVDLMLEPLAAPRSIAIFGVGHVGLELARILARFNVALTLVDSRPEMLSLERLSVLSDAEASVRPRVLVVPEAALADLPDGADLVIMTHDHAEDYAILDAALRAGRFGRIGVIGSRPKWARFRTMLAEAGHPAEAIDRVESPVGIPGINSKEPPAIAVSIVAGLFS